jgi:gliding motility-associated-like protein
VNNIPAIPGNTGVYTYTTNIGGGICPEDNALYTITIDPEITVSAATATCQPNQTEYGVVFNVLTGTNYSIEGTGIPPGSITGLNGAFSFNSASYGFIPAGTNYSFTISSSGSCPDVIVSGVSPVCTCLATAAFTSTSANVCEGSCTDLIISPSGGVYPYTVEYSDGANTFSETIFSGNATINVCPTAPTTYSITSVSDANCVGTPSPLTVTIGIETQPDAGSNVVLDYCGNGSTVNLFSELSPDADGGGVFTPSPNVVLNAINDGAVYTYTVSGTECPQDVATYTVNIEDQLSLSDVVVSCLPSQTEYTVSFTINGGSGAYNVTGANSQPPLGNSFVSLNIPIGQNYNFTISSVGGQCPAIPLTGAAPDCNCPATADFASGNVTICEGSCTDIEFELEGDAPYTISYTENGVPATINTSDPNYTLTVCPTATTVYSLTGINDVNCTGSAFGNVTVTVDEQLNAGSDVTITYCADGSNINLVNELSPDAELGGTWSPPPAPSFPATETNSGLYTYTVGGNACPDDMASYNLLFESEIDVISVLGNCLPSQTEYQVSFQITQGVVPMTITSSVPGFVPVAVNSLPFSYTSVPINFATNANYTFTVSSDNGLCNDWTITNPAPDCNCIAQGSFSGTTTICAGECTEIVFNGIGDAPFDITYTDSNGGSTNLSDIQNGHIITVCPAVETTYTLTAVSDSYCVGEVSGAPVTVGVDTQIQSTSVNEIIDADNEFFQVVIGLSGGNEATYSFSPAGGSYNSISGTYTSAWIPCGSGYNITVTDGGVCPALVINNPSFDCGCVSDAGTIDTAPLEVCIDETITVTNNGDETMDGNDVLQYILHDGTGGTIQNVLGRTFDGVFNMNNYPVVGGQTYCIVAVVGNADFSGNVMLSDECTSISNCVPVLVNPLPTATIVGGATVCVGENVGLIVTFTGTGPWDFTYTVNNTNATTESGITANPFTLNVNQTGNYAITTVTDSKGCNGFGQGVATVNNYVTPTATMTGEGDVCEGSGNGPIINFTGDAPYTFVYSIDGDVQPAITTSSSTYIIPAVEGGMYALTSLEGQYCTGTVSGSLFITINTPPTASISGGGEVCDGDLAPFVVNLTGEAPWTVNYAVDGIPQGQLTEGFVNFYEFESGVEGAYSIVSVSDANCVGSGIPSDANLVVNPIPTAEISSNTTGFCIGEEIELNVELDGVPPFDITYVLNEDTLTMIGLLTSTTMSMTPNVPINAEIILVEDGSNPTCSSEPFSSVFVDAGVLPNAPVLSDDSLCASYGSTRIGVPAAPGLSYSWEPQDNLDNPNVSNPLFLTGQPGPTPRFYTYVLTATNGECSSTDTMTVKVDPGPIARFNYSPDPVMSEDTRVYFNNNTVGGSGELIYYWEFDSLDTSDEENPNYQFPDGINDDYRISLTVIDAITGCMDDTYEILTVQPEMLIFVPNAFTPDGDGLNDLWGPVMKNVDPDNYTLQVLDRWGDVVFETTDPNQKWNGSLNGDDYYLGEGVYVWFIETKNNITLEEVDFSGKVTLIR